MLLGRLQEVKGSHAILAPDLQENLDRADALATLLMHMIDNFVQRTGMDVPVESMIEDPTSKWVPPTEPMLELDLYAAGIWYPSVRPATVDHGYGNERRNV